MTSEPMQRRAFITLLGGAAAAWPLAARAQQPAMPVVGFLGNTSPAAAAARVEGFRKGLNEAGLVEGRTVAIEFRWTEGRPDRVSVLAADLIQRRVAVIVVSATSVAGAKAATTTIPIVFVSAGDPIETGLVTSLNRPGGNVTGVSFNTTPINAKRLELLHELVPSGATIAILWDPNNGPVVYAESQLQTLEGAARTLGRDILVKKVATESEFDSAFASMAQGNARALFVGTGALYFTRRRQIVALAGRYSLPASYPQRDYVTAGGLMSYGASDTDAYRRGGIYVGRILKGEKPGDLPVELPTKYELIMNLATAKGMGVDIPAKLLALVDKVIE